MKAPPKKVKELQRHLLRSQTQYCSLKMNDWPLSQSVAKGRIARDPWPISGEEGGVAHLEKTTKLAPCPASNSQKIP